MALNRSESGRLMCRLGRTRLALHSFSILGGNRAAQVNFASIFAAARFKSSHKGELRSTRCPTGHGGADGYTNLLRRYFSTGGKGMGGGNSWTFW